MKKIVSLIMLVFVTSFITGCLFKETEKQNDKVTHSDLIKYMEEKYKDEFEYVDSFDGGFDNNKMDIIVSSKKLLNKEIYVGYENINGIENYTDNYTQLKYEEDTYVLIEESLSKIFDKDFLITHKIVRSNNNFDDNTTFEEFLKSDESGVRFYAVVSPDYKIADLENLERTVKEIFEENFADCDVNIYLARTKDEYLHYDEIPSWKLDELKKIEFEI